MTLRAVMIVLAASLASSAALAETWSCPPPASFVKVGACPTERELAWGYNAYCSDNNRAYDGDNFTCLSQENYNELKNTALWEAGDFMGYLPCNVPDEKIRMMSLQGVYTEINGMKMQMGGMGGMTGMSMQMGMGGMMGMGGGKKPNNTSRVVCEYEGGMRMIYRLPRSQ